MTTACRRSSRLPRHPRRRVVSDVKQAREGVIPTAVDRPGPTGAFTAVGLVLGEIEPHHDRPAALGIVEFFVDGIGEEHRAGQPEEPVATAQLTVEGVFNEGCQLEAQGQLEAAVARYEQVSAKYPGTTFARDAEQRLRMIRDKLNF